LAMIRLSTALHAAGSRSRMLLQVHDELVLEVPLEDVIETAQLVQDEMKNAFPLSIPLETEARSGTSWGTMEVLSKI